MIPVTGKMSTFGGQSDTGVGQHEGLALIDLLDLRENWFRRLFVAPLDARCGLARNLDPNAFYVAMRWDYGVTSKALLKHSLVRLSRPDNSRLAIFAQPVDFGPGDGTVIDGVRCPQTGRIADLSPGAANALGLSTDDEVTCQLILANEEIVAQAADPVLVEKTGAAAPGGARAFANAPGGKEVA